MKKLRLDLESIAVQTFETGDKTAVRGTVHARDSRGTSGPWECAAFCESGGSCESICVTCDLTCQPDGTATSDCG